MRDKVASRTPKVLFHSSYGEFPKFLWYVCMPVLLLAAVLLFVNAHWFGQGMIVKGVKLSPMAVKTWVCPGLGGMCVLINLLAIYRRLYPQEILVTDEGVVLPLGRWTQEVKTIPWEHLEATYFYGRMSFLEVYEVTCIDDRDKKKTRITSMLFRSFDDFVDFARLIGHRMGRVWPLPKGRGRKAASR